MDKPVSRQLVVGSVVFVMGFLSPLLIPLVLMLSLSPVWKSVLTAGLAFGIPEVMALLAVIIMGREGFQEFKQWLWGLVKKAAPPDRVGPVRYRIGLVMFTLPLVFAWIGPYLNLWMPDAGIHNVFLFACGDLLLIASLFVLGGQFWGKLRALFVWQANDHSRGTR